MSKISQEGLKELKNLKQKLGVHSSAMKLKSKRNLKMLDLEKYFEKLPESVGNENKGSKKSISPKRSPLERRNNNLESLQSAICSQEFVDISKEGKVEGKSKKQSSQNSQKPRAKQSSVISIIRKTSLITVILGISFTSLFILGTTALFSVFIITLIGGYNDMVKTSQVYVEQGKHQSVQFLSHGMHITQQIIDEFSFGSSKYDINWNDVYSRSFVKGDAEIESMTRFILQSIRRNDFVDVALVIFNDGVIIGGGTLNPPYQTYDYYFKRKKTSSYYPYGGNYIGVFELSYVNKNDYKKITDFENRANQYDPQKDDSYGWYIPEESYYDFSWDYKAKSHFKDFEREVHLSVTKELRDINSTSVIGCTVSFLSFQLFNSMIENIFFDKGDIIIVDKLSGLVLGSTIDLKVNSQVELDFITHTNVVIRAVSAKILSYSDSNTFLNVVDDVLGIFFFDYHSLVPFLMSFSSLSYNNMEIIVIHVFSLYTLFNSKLIELLVIFCIISLLFVVICTSLLILFQILFHPFQRTLKVLENFDYFEIESIELPAEKSWFAMKETIKFNQAFRTLINHFKECRSFVPLPIQEEFNGNENSFSDYSATDSDCSICSEDEFTNVKDEEVDINANNNSSVALTEFLINKMPTKMSYDDGFILIVYFMYDDIISMLDIGIGNAYVKFFDNFLTFILKNCRGNIIIVDFYCVILFYKIGGLLMKNAVSIKNYLDKLATGRNFKVPNEESETFSKGDVINFNIMIDKKTFNKGIIGNSSLRLPCIVYNTSLYEKILSFSAKNGILVTQEAVELLDPDLFMPIDVIKVDFISKLMILSRYIEGKIEIMEDQHMVEIQKKVLTKEGCKERVGMSHFMKRDWEKATKIYREILEEFIAKMKERGVMEDDFEKGKSKEIDYFQVWKFSNDRKERELLFRIAKIFHLSNSFLKNEKNFSNFVLEKKRFTSLFFE